MSFFSKLFGKKDAELNEQTPQQVDETAEVSASVTNSSDEKLNETDALKDARPEVKEESDTFSNENNVISDLSYIRNISVNEQVKSPFFGWKTFDIVFDTHGYGWEYMVDTANYMIKADVTPNDLSAYDLAGNEFRLREQLFECDGDLNKIEQLRTENGSLALMGVSKTLGKSVRLVWFNQTNVMRVYSGETDIIRMTRYVETLIRRTFGTNTEMALAKPVDKK